MHAAPLTAAGRRKDGLLSHCMTAAQQIRTHLRAQGKHRYGIRIRKKGAEMADVRLHLKGTARGNM